MLTLFHAPQSRSSALMTLIDEMGIADHIDIRQTDIPRMDGRSVHRAVSLSAGRRHMQR